jgi:hypothetical protein
MEYAVAQAEVYRRESSKDISFVVEPLKGINDVAIVRSYFRSAIRKNIYRYQRRGRGNSGDCG